MNKEFLLKDIFDIYKGDSKYTHKFAIKNPGEYPVYSSQTVNNGEIFKISTYDYDNDIYGKCLTWTTDGIYAGTLFIRNNKFSITTHAGVLILKENFKNLINVEYIYFMLKDILRHYAIGENNKRLTKNIIEKIKIVLPLKNNDIDIKLQDEVCEKLRKVQDIKDNMLMLIDKLNSIEVDPFPNNVEFKSIKAKDLFDLTISSNNSSFTKKVVKANKGEIPVYGASMNPHEVGYGYIKDNVPGIKYFSDCLTINRNGSAGFVHKRQGKFTISMDVTPLVLNKKFKTSVDLDFLTLAINRKLKNLNFGFTNKAGKDRIAKIDVEIPVENGKFSIEKQREIFNRYITILNIKNNIIEKIRETSESIVN